MATQTPPPYFPQNSLTPADANRYRKFKLTMLAVIVFLLLLLGGIVAGAFYLVKWLF
jgi:hypothetical protein